MIRHQARCRFLVSGGVIWEMSAKQAAMRCIPLAALVIGLVLASCAPVSEAPSDLPTAGNTFRDCPGCPEMVVIPAGTFMMGSSDSETDRTTLGARWRLNRERPQHSVTIGQSFALGKYKVSRSEFAAFLQETGYDARGTCYYWAGGEGESPIAKDWRDPGFSQSDHDPVVCVDWDDAQAYVTWLSRKTGKQYRLPSESEWEYAARSGTPLVSGFRDQANRFGLYDMRGYVGEWMEDCWHETYEGAPRNGMAWTNGEYCSRRAVRGAPWYYGPSLLDPVTRSRYNAHRNNVDIGFRIARH